LVQFGAPAEIEFLANPHVGSDRIRRVIPRLRQYLLVSGRCEIRFHTEVTEFITHNRTVTGVRTRSVKDDSQASVECERLILACGHSAESLFANLHAVGVQLAGKSFAMGLRIEHPQELINEIQYRQYKNHPKLGAANYKLAAHDDSENIGVYSFCMCPGGYVLSCSTDGLGVVSNGMSNFNRGSPFANAAIVVTIDHAKTFGDDLFGGLKWRASVEAQALQLVREAGGMITDLRGGAEMLTQGTVLAANENLHPQLLKLLKATKAPA
jgi:uncharacterized FAD-dependent dehydrogenase